MFSCAHYQRICSQAIVDYNRAARLLDKWAEARRRLYVGQSRYAVFLVWEMIEALTKIIKHDPEHTQYIPEAREYLDMLYALLEEDPPPLPPATDALLCRAFLFPFVLYCSHDYGNPRKTSEGA